MARGFAAAFLLVVCLLVAQVKAAEAQSVAVAFTYAVELVGTGATAGPSRCYWCQKNGFGCACPNGAYFGATDCSIVYPGAEPCYCLLTGSDCGQAFAPERVSLDGATYVRYNGLGSGRSFLESPGLTCKGIMVHPMPPRDKSLITPASNLSTPDLGRISL